MGRPKLDRQLLQARIPPAEKKVEIKFEWLSIFRLPSDYRTKNDELRFLSEQETSHREQSTETKENKSCRNIWFATTSPTTSTRPR